MAPSKQVIIDSLVLVFSKSRISSIVGTDALRSVLDGLYRDLMKENSTFELQGVWDLLAEQPGFDADDAKPPIARFKQHEALLEINVVLPSVMAGLDQLQLQNTAAHCPVSDQDILKLYDKHDPAKKAERAAKRAEAIAEMTAPQEEAIHARSRMPLLIGALVIALATFAFVGYQVYIGLSPSPDFQEMKTDSFKGIPVKSAKRQGRQAVVRLSDDAWVNKKDKAALEGALRNVSSDGIEVIVVTNKKGDIVASAQFAKGRKVKVTFR